MEPFKIEIEDKEKTIEKIKKFVISKQGKFNEEEQTFSGLGVKGKYEIEGNICIIHILKKPFLVSEEVIESMITGFIKET